MPRRSVLFRVDAGPGIGSGHAMRSLALAQYLRDQGRDCHLQTRFTETEAIRYWRTEGIALHTADGVDGAETVRLASSLSARWVVVDGYHFDLPFQRTLKDSGLKLLCFDDLANQPLLADIIVNQNPGAENRANYESPTHSEILLGSQYVMLRKDLLQSRRPSSRQHPHLFITFGGDDRENLALSAMKELDRLDQAFSGTVVCSSGPDGFAAACDFARRRPERWRVIAPTLHIGDLMAASDLALCAGGTTVLELSYLGTPAILVITADNQLPGSEYLAANGRTILCGRGRQAIPKAVAQIQRLLTDPQELRAFAQRTSGLIDGRGPERVAARLT